MTVVLRKCLRVYIRWLLRGGGHEVEREFVPGGGKDTRN